MAQAKRSDPGTSWLLTESSLFAGGLDRVCGDTLWEYAQLALFMLAWGFIGASIPLMVSRRTK